MIFGSNTEIMNEELRIQVPATIANIVCGFDILGMAVNEPYDEIRIRLVDGGKIVIRHTDTFGLPEEIDRNVAGVSLSAMLKHLPDTTGFEVSIHKNIMPGSGLGSSAASSVGVVAAANKLLGNPFSFTELLGFAREGEQLASGAGHYDNIAPCLYGGITLIQNSGNVSVTPIPHPPLWCTIVHPQIEVKTSDSRKIIKKEIPVKTAIRQWSNIAGLITGFFKNDYQLISRSLEDVIFEPARSILIPGFREVKDRCLQAGALGGGISGSGPSIFMLSSGEHIASEVEEAMKQVYDATGLSYKTYITTIKPSPLI